MSQKNIVSREALSRAAALVRPALSNQSFVPSLTHIKFEGGWMTAYNDITAISVKGPVSSDVELCLPGDMLVKAISGFSAQDLAIQENAKEESVLLSSGRSKLKLPALKASDFPFELPRVDDAAATVRLSAAVLSGISMCLMSVGTDPTHAAQMGVTLDTNDEGQALLFSTDNFTISRYEASTKVKLPAGSPIILPTFFCEQLVALAKAFPDCDVDLHLHAGAIVASVGDIAALFTKMVDDLQPIAFEEMICKYFDPYTIDKKANPSPDGLADALGRALLVLQGESDKVVKVSLGDGTFKMSAASSLGDSSDTFSFDTDLDLDSFHTDPGLLSRALKQTTHLAFLPRVVVLCTKDGSFIHMVSHCTA